MIKFISFNILLFFIVCTSSNSSHREDELPSIIQNNISHLLASNISLDQVLFSNSYIRNEIIGKAEARDSEALFLAGVLYSKGYEEIEKNEEKSFDYLLSAAKLRNKYAQYIIAVASLKGIDIGIDKETALNYLKDSANQKHMGSQYELGIIYLKAKQSDIREKAITYLKMSATQGYKPAIKILTNSD